MGNLSVRTRLESTGNRQQLTRKIIVPTRGHIRFARTFKTTSKTRMTERGTTWDAQVSTQKVIPDVNPPTVSSTASSTLVNGFVPNGTKISHNAVKLNSL
jgi:hypothetical protein